MLINVNGQQQVVALLAEEVIGFSPDNGTTSGGIRIRPATDWRSVAGVGARQHPVRVVGVRHRQPRAGVASGERTDDGARAVARPADPVAFGTVIRRGDFVYLSSGHSGPAFMTAVNVKTGQVAWQQRGFAKAQLLYADGKFVMLDEDGTLALATATPQQFSVLAQAPLLKRIAWTPPTLVGTRLYVATGRRSWRSTSARRRPRVVAR